MCDFGSRTARWGLDVPATLLARADEVMNAECPLLALTDNQAARSFVRFGPKRTKPNFTPGRFVR
jgi:hypothetical protein